jgi:hypothetical protein
MEVSGEQTRVQKVAVRHPALRWECPSNGSITFWDLSDQSKLLPRKAGLAFLRHYNFFLSKDILTKHRATVLI